MRNNSMALRYDYDNAVSVFAAAFGARPDSIKSRFKFTQSFLRLEQPLSATNTSYNFPVLNNIQSSSGQFITERRLAQQDSFIPTAIGFYVAKPASNTDASFKLYSYLNPTIMGAADAAALQVVYNGSLSLALNNVVYIPAWDIQKHWLSPQTQETAAFATGVNVDQFAACEDGKFPSVPYVALIGSRNIQLTLTLPAAPAALVSNYRAVVWFDGFLAQNSTVVV